MTNQIEAVRFANHIYTAKHIICGCSCVYLYSAKVDARILSRYDADRNSVI